MIQRAKKQQGFTMIELTLAMAFVSVLLLTIAMTVIQMGQIFNRGMAIKAVNQSSRDVADDLRRSVQSAGIFEINADGSDTTDYVTFTESVKGVQTVTTGRLCLGNYSYIWNTATALETSFDDRARYLNSSGGVGDAVSLAKVADTGKKYCAVDTDGSLLYRDILYADAANTTELLPEGDRTIRVLSFSATSTDTAYDTAAGQRLYKISYSLGTGATSAMSFTGGTPTSCLPPNDPNSNFAYCNVQQFGIVLRAGNTVN